MGEGTWSDGVMGQWVKGLGGQTANLREWAASRTHLTALCLPLLTFYFVPEPLGGLSVVSDGSPEICPIGGKTGQRAWRKSLVLSRLQLFGGFAQTIAGLVLQG